MDQHPHQVHHQNKNLLIFDLYLLQNVLNQVYLADLFVNSI